MEQKRYDAEGPEGVEEDVSAHLEETLEKDEDFRREWERNRGRRELGLHLLAKRLDRGLSQREVAQRVGTSQNRIYLLEKGEANPTLDTLQKLSEVLEFDLEIRTGELVAHY